MDVLWPEWVGYGHLTCDQTNSCFGMEFPIPSPNIPLIITCDSGFECERAVIHCPENAGCIINCIARGSCQRVICQFILPMTHNAKDKMVNI